MGVTGLWQLIGPIGKPVTLESLENKVLAVDVSIWLNQALKGFRDGHGQSVPNAHIASLCHRICKLLFYKIKPVFVFDGTAPLLKKQTLAARERQRQTVTRNVNRTAHRLLHNLIATEVVQSKSKKISPKKTKVADTKTNDDIFCLPSMGENIGEQEMSEHEEDEEEAIDDVLILGHEQDFQDLASVDTSSSEFKSLPPDVRYELLSAMKNFRRRQHHHNLPPDSDDFSRFQMQNLLERNRLQRGMDAAAKELTQKQVGEVMDELFQEGEADTHRIVSEDSAHAVLIRKTKKPQEETNEELSKEPILDDLNEFIITSSSDDDEEMKMAKKESLRLHKSQGKEEVAMVDISGENDTFSSKKTQETGVCIKDQRDYSTASTSKSDDSWGLITLKSNETDAVSDWLKDVKQNNVVQEVLSNEALCRKNFVENTKSNLNVSIGDNLKSIPVPKVLNLPSENCAVNSSPNHEDNITVADLLDNESHLTKSGSDCTSLKKAIMLSPLPPVKDQSMRETDHAIVSETSKHLVSTEDNNDRISKSNVSISVEMDETLPVRKSTDADVLVCNNLQANEKTIETTVVKESQNLTVELKSAIELGEDELFPAEIFQTKASYPSSEEEIQELVPEIVQIPPDPVSSEDEIEVLLNKDLLLNAPNEEVALSMLEVEREVLMRKRADQERQSQTISQQMLDESKNLLRLFGIPFIVSPTEAEAQCAALESLRLTQGTITDDSDIWLFGGERVYRHFFQQDKYVQLFTTEEIKTHFGLDRDRLICFAMLTGSDYTEGVEGVGPVTAMEVLAEFKGEGLQTLTTLKSWWSKHHEKRAPPGNALRAKLTSLRLSKSFPRGDVYEAYLTPSVDNSNEKFSWQQPDLCALRELLNEKLGWRIEKIDNLLLPVMKKINEHQSQTRLDSFFTRTLKREAVLPPSKRLQKALQKVQPRSHSESSDVSSTNNSVGEKRKQRSKQTESKNVQKGSKNTRLRAANGTVVRKRVVQVDSDPDDPVVRKTIQECVLSESDSDSDCVEQVPWSKRRKAKKL